MLSESLIIDDVHWTNSVKLTIVIMGEWLWRLNLRRDELFNFSVGRTLIRFCTILHNFLEYCVQSIYIDQLHF